MNGALIGSHGGKSRSAFLSSQSGRRAWPNNTDKATKRTSTSSSRIHPYPAPSYIEVGVLVARSEAYLLPVIPRNFQKNESLPHPTSAAHLHPACPLPRDRVCSCCEEPLELRQDGQ